MPKIINTNGDNVVSGKMNIVVNAAGDELVYDDGVVIDYQLCIKWYGDAMQDSEYILHKNTLKYAMIVFDDIDINEDNYKTQGNGVAHLLARLELTAALQSYGYNTIWRLPESGIYPKYQANIAELMIEMGFSPDYLLFNQSKK